MEEDLVAQLLANPALAALVGQRITWNVRDQGAPLPAVVLQLVSGPPSYFTQGRSRLAEYLIQVDCWGATFGQAKNVVRAAAAALATLSGSFRTPGFVEDQRDDAFRTDAATDLHRSSLDVRAWFYHP